MLKTTIPFVDLRGKTPIDLLRAYPDRALGLVMAARRTFGVWSYIASAAALPLADRRSHKWLKRTRNPYLHEIETLADILGIRGVHALNLCYEWGCTGGAYRTEETVALLRVLDWPFPELGRQVVVALQEGRAGEFYNVTWPGVSGVFTAMKPGRFAAALHSAPMRRHHRGLAGDWLKNQWLAGRADGLPPSHALRQVFEQAGDYDEAKAMLMETKIAVPAIFILSGIGGGEGCVIERLEEECAVSELSGNLQVSASNHFNTRLEQVGLGWRPREIDSHGRYRQSSGVHGHELAQGDFGWLRAPIINRLTRLCVSADAAENRLRAQGFEGSSAVTEVFELPGMERRARGAG